MYLESPLNRRQITAGDSPHQENNKWKEGQGFDASLINDSDGRRLPASMICIVNDTLYHWYRESPTLHIVDAGNEWLSASMMGRVDESPYERNAKLKKSLCNSLHKQYVESLTFCINYSGIHWLGINNSQSWRLPKLTMLGVPTLRTNDMQSWWLCVRMILGISLK